MKGLLHSLRLGRSFSRTSRQEVWAFANSALYDDGLRIDDSAYRGCAQLFWVVCSALVFGNVRECLFPSGHLLSGV